MVTPTLHAHVTCVLASEGEWWLVWLVKGHMLINKV